MNKVRIDFDSDSKWVKDNTTLLDGAGKADAIKSRVGMINKQIEESGSDYDKEMLQERKAKLAGGVALLRA